MLQICDYIIMLQQFVTLSFIVVKNHAFTEEEGKPAVTLWAYSYADVEIYFANVVLTQ